MTFTCAMFKFNHKGIFFIPLWYEEYTLVFQEENIMKLIKYLECKIFAQLKKAQSEFSEITKDKMAQESTTSSGKKFGRLNADELFIFQSLEMKDSQFILNITLKSIINRSNMETDMLLVATTISA